MLLDNLTIRSRLFGSAVIIFIVLTGIGLMTRYYMNKNQNYNELMHDVQTLVGNEHKMRKAEKDFLFIETSNPIFYETGISAHFESFEETYNESEEILASFAKNRFLRDNETQNKIAKLQESFHNYHSDMCLLISKVKAKGFKDYGSVGEMRNQIHNVEQVLKIKDDTKAGYYMLMLRRHEKDYLLRKDLKYLDKFEKTLGEFKRYLAITPSKSNTELLNNLAKYKILFASIIEKDKELGFVGGNGLMTDLNNSVLLIENQLKELHQQLSFSASSAIKESTVILLSVLGGLSLLVLVILWSTGHSILRPVRDLKNHILMLGEGQLPKPMKLKGENEVVEMANSIDVLTENLVNTRNFAVQVGNGNFQTDIDVFNNEGDLGGSLIEMRNRLLKVAEERESQVQKDNQRLWINEGIAKFEKILRGKFDEMEQIAQEFVNTLVSYTYANQGAIFIRRDSDSVVRDSDEDIYYDLAAAYAYGRKKYVRKSVKIGEDLVGMCAIEGQEIFMTDIPENYIEISSGLGHARPRNLVLIPMKKDDMVMGVVEIASFEVMEPYKVQFLKNVALSFADSLMTIRQDFKNKKLIEQMHEQTHELRSQEEELRQNMEELTATQDAMVKTEEELKERIKELETYSEQTINDLKSELKYQEDNNHQHSSLVNVMRKSYWVAEMNLNGEVLSGNTRMASGLRIAEGNLQGLNLQQYVAKSSEAEYQRALKDCTQSGITVDVYVDLIIEDEEQALRITFFPLMDNMDEVRKVYFVGKMVAQKGKTKDSTPKVNVN